MLNKSVIICLPNIHTNSNPQEPPRLKEGGARAPAGWPASGALAYSGVWASYRPGLPPVLKDLTFSLPGGCSCGVVG